MLLINSGALTAVHPFYARLCWLSSKVLVHRSRAASSAEFCKSGFGGRGLRVVISPISTLSASLSLVLGELSGRAIRKPTDGRSGLARVGVRRAPGRRSRAAAAR